MALLGGSWFQLLVAGAFGVIFTQFAFLGHEASHRQIAASGPANDRMGRVLATLFVGISYSWWMTKHNRHHANPNTIGKDPDIEIDTISFIEEDAAKQRGLFRVITRKQGYLFFPLLAFEGVNLHVTLVRHAVPARQGRRPRARNSPSSRCGSPSTSASSSGCSRSAWRSRSSACSWPSSASTWARRFAPNHKGMPLIEPGVKVDFLGKQVLTSRNIRGIRDHRVHGRPQLPGRAPPVPEHAPPAPAQGRGDRA